MGNNSLPVHMLFGVLGPSILLCVYCMLQAISQCSYWHVAHGKPTHAPEGSSPSQRLLPIVVEGCRAVLLGRSQVPGPTGVPVRSYAQML